jgi:hypothetical protein
LGLLPIGADYYQAPDWDYTINSLKELLKLQWVSVVVLRVEALSSEANYVPAGGNGFQCFQPVQQAWTCREKSRAS